MSALKEKYSPEILVVTDGRNGGYYWQNGQAEHYDSVKIKAVDTNGAGDTFHGAFIAAYCYGKTLQECCVYKVGLAKLVNRYKKCEELLEKFYLTFKCLWFKENKPQGFDAQDLRFGGLVRRLRSCRERLEEYLSGEVNSIPELEEKLLDFYGNGENFEKEKNAHV